MLVQEFHMDLFNDLNSLLQAEATHRGFTLNGVESVEDLLHMLIQHEKKLISSRPRQVHESREFQSKLQGLTIAQQNAYSTIRKKLENGEDVTGHLSRLIQKQDFVDLLLADWALHHIHLSDTKRNASDHFFDRSDQLAFAIVFPAQAVFVDIRPHSEQLVFARRELLEIIHANWPELLEPYRLRGVIDVAYNADDEAIAMLRKGGVNTILKIGDAVYAPPGGGLTSAGTSLSVGMEADRFMFYIKDLESGIKEREADLRAQISETHGIPPDELEFKLFNDGGSFHVRETKTNTVVAPKED